MMAQGFFYRASRSLKTSIGFQELLELLTEQQKELLLNLGQQEKQKRGN